MVDGLCASELYLTGGLGEVDEVDLRFLILAEGLELLVLRLAGSERDDVAGGLRHLELRLLGEVHRVLLILIRRKLLEELVGERSLLLAGLGLGRQQVINHFNDYIL